MNLFKHFGFTENSNLFNKLGSMIDQGFFIVLAAIGTVFLTIGGAYAGSYEFSVEWEKTTGWWGCFKLIFWNPNASLFFGSASFLFGALGTFKDQSAQNKKMSILQDENVTLVDTRQALNTTQEQLQESKSELAKLHTDLVETWLLGVCKHLGLNSKERITIYYEHDEEFYLLARHSRNPHFSKVHRQKFPLNQGVIGQSWQHDVCIEVECPSSENLDAYKNFMNQKYGYDLSKLESLTMKSCRYVAKAISDAGVHIGVIVFESESDDFVSREDDEKIKEILAYCEEHQSQIAKFVRDGFKYSKEINLKSENQVQSVEDDFLELLNGGSDE
ncbi:hypothetical protein M2G44_17970 [Vibrio vulnificus]|nr:hypothetical protein [Vibrio vulnificus]